MYNEVECLMGRFNYEWKILTWLFKNKRNILFHKEILIKIKLIEISK